MTPDEIRTAVRLLNKPVYYVGIYPVVYQEGKYQIQFSHEFDSPEPIFNKEGGFRNDVLGKWRFREADFTLKPRSWR